MHSLRGFTDELYTCTGDLRSKRTEAPLLIVFPLIVFLSLHRSSALSWSSHRLLVHPEEPAKFSQCLCHSRQCVDYGVIFWLCKTYVSGAKSSALLLRSDKFNRQVQILSSFLYCLTEESLAVLVFYQLYLYYREYPTPCNA